MRGDNLSKSIFAVGIDHVIKKGPLKTSAVSFINGPSSPSDFSSSLKIEIAESLVQFYVVFRGKGKVPFFAEGFNTDIICGIQRRLNSFHGKIGKNEERFGQLLRESMQIMI